MWFIVYQGYWTPQKGILGIGFRKSGKQIRQTGAKERCNSPRAARNGFRTLIKASESNEITLETQHEREIKGNKVTLIYPFGRVKAKNLTARIQVVTQQHKT